MNTRNLDDPKNYPSGHPMLRTAALTTSSPSYKAAMILLGRVAPDALTRLHDDGTADWGSVVEYMRSGVPSDEQKDALRVAGWLAGEEDAPFRVHIWTLGRDAIMNNWELIEIAVGL